MSKFKVYLIAFSLVSILFSCNKSDDAYIEPVRSYSDQYKIDKIQIETYLKNHYIENIVDHPGFPDDQDITLSPITDAQTQQSIWDSPMLDSVAVTRNDVDYIIYYIKQREGVGQSPSRADKVFAAYDGLYISSNATTEPIRFEYVPTPTSEFPLHSVIPGWTEVFPLFKSGTLVNPGGTDPEYYQDFGAGVMFIPSGLGYFNVATTVIPSYSPLIFKFKFYAMSLDDADADGIYSNDEDLNHNGIFTDDDSDGDGTPNYQDIDDDGDGYLTKTELMYLKDGTQFYYPYEGAATDDPATPNDETIGAPRKFTGPSQLIPGTTDHYWNIPNPDGSDFNDPNRLRRYLDPTATPPYFDQH